MLRETDLLSIKHWFEIYTRHFFTGDEHVDSAIDLKVKHTKNVAIEILDIAHSLNLDTEYCYLAEIVALLHDIGRFEQYIRYHTYSDRKSEDHAKLGVEVMAQTGVIKEFTPYEQDLIRTIVAHHNRASLPQSDDQKFLLLLKLLRDADKIDILHVVTEHYAGYSRNQAINIGLPDTPEISKKIVNSIQKRRLANVHDMKTLNDFKLLQVSWVFDLNFTRTFQVFRQRRYLDKLSATLPEDSIVTEALASAHGFLLRNYVNERSDCGCPIP
jgi:putative nucleotidyltransferase with HDIG domain